MRRTCMLGTRFLGLLVRIVIIVSGWAMIIVSVSARRYLRTWKKLEPAYTMSR